MGDRGDLSDDRAMRLRAKPSIDPLTLSACRTGKFPARVQGEQPQRFAVDLRLEQGSFVAVDKCYADQMLSHLVAALTSSQEDVLDADIVDHLKSLHTNAVDARNGYQEALEDAKGNGMTALFRNMVALHQGNAAELARELTKANQLADDEGSFMTVVHKTIMDIRSLFNGLDQSVLPGLIDGEKRNVAKYDEALKDKKTPRDLASLLTAQRGKIARKVAQMEADKAASEPASA